MSFARARKLIPYILFHYQSHVPLLQKKYLNNIQGKFPLTCTIPTPGLSHHHLELGVHPFRLFSTHAETHLHRNTHIIVEGLFCFVFPQKRTYTIYIILLLAFFFFTQDRITKIVPCEHRITSLFSMATERGHIPILLTTLLLSDRRLASSFSPPQSGLQGAPDSYVLAYLWEFFCGSAS